MDIASNVKIVLNEDYVFSISQEVDTKRKNLVEVALVEPSNHIGTRLVPCSRWATYWVGEDYDDDVIRFLDAHDVGDLLTMAREYVYLKEQEEHEAANG